MTGDLKQFNQTRYQCPHCRKSWAQKGRAIRHIDSGCHRDPATATCATCTHYQRGYDASWEEPGGSHYCQADVAISDLTLMELPRQCDEWDGKA